LIWEVARSNRSLHPQGGIAMTKPALSHQFILVFLLLSFALIGSGCRKGKPPRLTIDLVDTNSMDKHSVDSIATGDSLSIGLTGLAPGVPVQVYLNDDAGKEWSYARLFADKRGNVEPSLFWYQTGVIGTTSRQINFKPDPSFVTFEEAEAYFNKHHLKLTVKDLKGNILGDRQLTFRPRQSPMVYPSNKDGVLSNAYNLQKEDVYATGKNFPAGAIVQLFAVNNQYVWKIGDKLADESGKDQSPAAESVTLGPNQTSFTVKIWDHGVGRPGSYDIVARIGKEAREQVLRPDDILSYGEDTGMILYLIINGNIVIDSAGRMKDAPAKFEFSDSFEKQENVYGAVDPSDVPAVHSGGNYAAYYVVDHQPASYWDGVSPALVDVSGGIEIQRVKYWCINASRRLIWPNATQSAPIKDYDVIVDFGAVPAMDSASFVQDDVYNKGTDFLDGYNNVGFTVFEDPSTTGPFAVGTVELNDPTGISGITDPTGMTGPTQNVTLAWARIMYPATTAGTGTPVSGTLPNYPVALFLHGRHWNCDNDGSGPGLAGGYSFSCTPANRIPSHEGYNYIMERLASQGIFCISISAHDIQPGLGAWDYDARGRLILKFLDKLKDWNDNGTDPFGAIFAGKIDMTKIALSGHSRGGEGVVAAQELNQTWPTHYSIVAVNAIAPTDQNAVSYLMTDAAYYLLIGARDGDVATMQGFRTYDRAFPDGAPMRKPKTVAWLYGASHNYFNTIWTDAAALGSPNPWAGQTDDGGSLTVSQTLTAAEQRQVALTTVCAFFRWHLQGIDPYREIFTGRLKPAAMANQFVFWTYQDGDRKALDNFEQTPLNAAQNTLLGSVTAPGFTTFEERLLNNGGTDYPGVLPTDTQFFHDTLGLKLAWAAPQTYTTNIPAGIDVSAYTHLTLRAAKKVGGAPMAGPVVNLLVNVQDGGGHTGMWNIRTDQFDPIPHPYLRSGGWCAACTNQALLVGVRIPLRNFTMNNSGVDLTNIVRVTIITEGSGEIGIDDIEFGK
jgi:hypothetical protein